MYFSIGIPAFKAKYLEECLASILSQSFQGFEIIIVNDASPDNIDEIVSSIRDPRISYYKNQKNIGAEHVVDNWNKCLAHAKGDYFVLMGDDDVMEYNYLDDFKKLIDSKPEIDVFHCRSWIINEDSKKIELSPSWPEFESVYENIWHRLNTNRVQFISDFVYRTSTLKKNGGYYKLPLAWASDDISSYIAMSNKGIAHINLPLLNYRRNSSTISNTGDIALKLESISQEYQWISEKTADSTPNKIDEVYRLNIRKTLKKYFRKKRVMTISRYMEKGFINGLIKILSLRGITTSEKIISVIYTLK